MRRMRLADWLSREGRKHVELAEELDVHPVTVGRWTAGRVVPRMDMIKRIHALSKGQVSAQDFMEGHTGVEARAAKARRDRQAQAPE